MSTNYELNQNGKSAGGEPQHLSAEQVEMIEEALRNVGEFGEVRLVVEKGKLRFLVTQTSMDALKWRPGRANGL